MGEKQRSDGADVEPSAGDLDLLAAHRGALEDGQGHLEHAVAVGRVDLVRLDRLRQPERAVVGALPAAGLVLVLRGDREPPLVPVDLDLLEVEPGQLDAQEELVVLLVQFDVGASLTEQSAREVEAAREVRGGTRW